MLQISVLGFPALLCLLMFLCSLTCRPSLAEKAESGPLAPASPQPLTSERHLLPALPPQLQDTAEFPTPLPTLPEGHALEALPTPPVSPCPPPHPTPASPPASSADHCEDVYPSSPPCHVPLRYEPVTIPEPLHHCGAHILMW